MRLGILLAAGAALGTNFAALAQPDWLIDSFDDGVVPRLGSNEDFLLAGPPWDSDGLEACPPLGADDVRCEWLEEHGGADPAIASNGVIAATLNGADAQRAVFLSEVWGDPLDTGDLWWVNYDAHFIALDPADLPDLRVIMRFKESGVTRLTLNLSGEAGASRVQEIVAPQHNWHETPETSPNWQIELVLRRVSGGAPAMIWIDNISITEGPDELYSETFPLIPGDLDGDCNVAIDDLAAQLSNFGKQTGATRADGDLDGDGDVDIEDLATLLSWFGTSC